MAAAWADRMLTSVRTTSPDGAGKTGESESSTTCNGNDEPKL
jgi:hypothetical protein